MMQTMKKRDKMCGGKSGRLGNLVKSDNGTNAEKTHFCCAGKEENKHVKNIPGKIK